MPSFDSVLEALGGDRFLRDQWAKEFVHMAGSGQAFERLTSWDDLSALLSTGLVTPKQMKLLSNGSVIPAEQYVERFPDARTEYRSAELINLLANGATLLIDHIDRLIPRLGDFASRAAVVLEATVNVNLYAGWRRQNGFKLHWDPSDVLILQVHGEKHWEVHRPTREHPLENEPAEPPTTEPVWAGLLREGDVLHLPRGWWHIARPLDRPSLHLTLTSSPPVGIDIAKAFVERLADVELLRHNVPRYGDEREVEEYEAALRVAIADAARTIDVRAFLIEAIADRRTRQRIEFPGDPIEAALPIGLASMIRVSSVEALRIAPGRAHGSIAVTAVDQEIECPEVLRPALAELRGSSDTSAGDLLAHLQHDDGSDLSGLLLITLTRMSLAGMLRVTSAAERPQP